MMKMVVIGGLAVWPVGGVAEAHGRDYLVNQPYYTAKKGEVEVELYNDVNFSDADNDETYNTKHQVEVEYGLFEHFQLAYYEVYKWDRTDDVERDEFKLEGKYRFAEAGQWPADVALYLEYANPNGRRETSSDELEGKLILSRDFGPMNLTANLITEKKLNAAEGWDVAYTLGTSYAVLPATRVGLELTETLGRGGELGVHRADHKLQVIPGVYTSLTKHLRLLLGVAFGLTKASDDVQLKSIIELEF